MSFALLHATHAAPVVNRPRLGHQLYPQLRVPDLLLPLWKSMTCTQNCDWSRAAGGAGAEHADR